jgi:hypothetical protein
MKIVRRFAAVVLVAAFAAPVFAVDPPTPPKPGPEHDLLKKMEGNWDFTMKGEGFETKGTTVYKFELGGLWLVGSMKCDLGFEGKGLDTYDATKKVYRSVWFDSMSATPMIMEGTYDKDTKTMTMTGNGPDMSGKVVKWKSVSTMPDDDTINFAMHVGDAKEPMFAITYKRKK